MGTFDGLVNAIERKIKEEALNRARIVASRIVSDNGCDNIKCITDGCPMYCGAKCSANADYTVLELAKKFIKENGESILKGDKDV